MDSVTQAKALVDTDLDAARKLGELAGDMEDATTTLFLLTIQSMLLCNARVLKEISDELLFRRQIDYVGKEGE